MNGIGTFHLPREPNAIGWNARIMVLGVVVAFHGLAYIIWSHAGKIAVSHTDRIEISFDIAQPHMSSAPAHMPKLEKITQPQQSIPPVPVEPAQAEEKTQALTVPLAKPVAATAAPAVAAITEPEYKASYLNNTPPSYPLAARRMGMQGRVLLHVEVLAAGVSGKIEVSQSSGHAMLDTAAMNAVKSWRFVPATQAGHSVDKWFIIPIQFSLKEA